VMENEYSGAAGRLAEAHACLGRDDLAGAVAIYEALLAEREDDGDVLQAVSGDLGAAGHYGPIVQMLGPLYDPERHGPGAGVNLLQAYLALGDPDSADHILGMLRGFGDPELGVRLRGFAAEVARLRAAGVEAGEQGGAPPAASAAKGTAVSISKPVWFYGLEPLAGAILPVKEGGLRRVGFTQLALPGAHADLGAALKRPEDGMARLSRAIPVWLAETFLFATRYDAVAALALITLPGSAPRPAILDREWTEGDLKELVRTTAGGLDYIFSGTLRSGGGFELELRLWEVRKMRERKRFIVRWTEQDADAQLGSFRNELRRFMEWSPCPDPTGAGHAPEGSPRAWIDALGLSLSLFLAGKKLWPVDLLRPVAPALEALAPLAASDPAAALALLTALARARELGIDAGPAPAGPLAEPDIVTEARRALGMED
jgi:hypothetical protein